MGCRFKLPRNCQNIRIEVIPPIAADFRAKKDKK